MRESTAIGISADLLMDLQSDYTMQATRNDVDGHHRGA